MAVPPGKPVRVTGAACPAGSVPIGGGYVWHDPHAHASVIESRAVAGKWRYMFKNNSGKPSKVSVISQCVGGGGGGGGGGKNPHPAGES
ncbi:hypothetical protein MF672_000220 [Actinomadura sp. ATCC 31491]|uniref:CBM2 domain-containing protein n=1 Tax=Actinomadura luzonensis TaxID=2805427 RepID=A0ABT0FIU7_9ACTN|nr:hypothetical protein [Actinomadura luzonensis]MCK2212231.1 hypothetical protein [Actinomadura luzonensis]